MRINKYLAECGLCSRRKADEIVKAGKVSVNKKVITELGFQVDELNDEVYIDGKKIVRPLHYVYYMFNKPKGCVTTASDDRGRKTVFDYVKFDERVFPVGRLDYDSEGLLILTNDGALAQSLTHPSHEVPKTYVVRIEGDIVESDLAILRKGAVVDGERYAPARVKVSGVEYIDDEGQKKAVTRLEVTITEGKNREIRKMFAAVEKNVVFLKRVAVGDLRLGGVSRGGYRELNEYEVAYLQQLGLDKKKTGVASDNMASAAQAAKD